MKIMHFLQQVSHHAYLCAVVFVETWWKAHLIKTELTCWRWYYFGYSDDAIAYLLSMKITYLLVLPQHSKATHSNYFTSIVCQQ